jgi:hypothetical protein
MVENHEAGLPSLLGDPSVDTITVTLPDTSTRENDALPALEKRFNALVAELDRDVECSPRRSRTRSSHERGRGDPRPSRPYRTGDHGDAGVHDRGVGRESAPRRLCVVPILGSAHRSDRLGCAGRTAPYRSSLRRRSHAIALSNLRDDEYSRHARYAFVQSARRKERGR